MRGICSRLATAALVAAGVATAIGSLAPWWPRADLPNQFTPFILAVAVTGLVLLTFDLRALATRRPARLVLAAGLAGVAVINAAPLHTVLATTAVAAQRPTDTLTVVSFNIWSKNRRLDEVSRWLREVRVVGLRPRFINDPARYAAHYDWLVRNAGKLGDRVILAGDFNAAPWSWQMMRFVAASGLRRHGTYAASWPSLLPVFLIDNLLATQSIKSVSFKTGPVLGSDHLPVIATVSLQ